MSRLTSLRTIKIRLKFELKLEIVVLDLELWSNRLIELANRLNSFIPLILCAVSRKWLRPNWLLKSTIYVYIIKKKCVWSFVFIYYIKNINRICGPNYQIIESSFFYNAAVTITTSGILIEMVDLMVWIFAYCMCTSLWYTFG